MAPSRTVQLACRPPLDRNPAALALGARVHENQHTLVVDVEVPFGGELQRATPGQRVGIVAPGFDSSDDWTIGVERGIIELGVARNQPRASRCLDLRRGQAKVGVQTAHELDVLLGAELKRKSCGLDVDNAIDCVHQTAIPSRQPTGIRGTTLGDAGQPVLISAKGRLGTAPAGSPTTTSLAATVERLSAQLTRQQRQIDRLRDRVKGG